MPIEHMGGRMGAEEMGNGAPPEPPSEGDETTATLDLSILGGQDVAPGDIVKLEVVSVDNDMGSLKVRYPKTNKPSGIDEMAAKFDRQPDGDSGEDAGEEY